MISRIISDRRLAQGEDFLLQIRVYDHNPERKPHNFASFQGATAYFANQDTTQPAVAVTGVNPETNLLQFQIGAAISPSIMAGDPIDFYYKWQENGLVSIEQVIGQFEVVAQLF